MWALAAAPAAAGGGLTDWKVSRLKLDLGDGWSAQLGGAANLTGYRAQQSGGFDRTGATASAFIFPHVEKLFANGWRVGLRGALDVYHDQLSGDNYGNDAVEKLYFFVHTPYGRFELGQQDGAAYKMSVTGPAVSSELAIDDANVVLFRDPSTGGALFNPFQVRTGIFTTANAAKISYYSPRLFGLQIGASYTPRLVKDVIPFVTTAPHVADRQDNLFEGAVNYTGYFGRTALGAYAGFATGHNAQRTAGHDDVFDWGLGGELDYDFGGATLAVGGAWRQSNGYTFDPGAAMRTGTTHAVHASSKLTTGYWQLGLEYSRGQADAAATMPKLDLTGYQVNVGFDVSENLQLIAGWQHQRFTRDSGVFYSGGRALDLDGGYLSLHIHV